MTEFEKEKTRRHFEGIIHWCSDHPCNECLMKAGCFPITGMITNEKPLADLCKRNLYYLNEELKHDRKRD